MSILHLPRSAATVRQREEAIDRAVLAALHAAGGEAPFARLRDQLPCSPRELWRSLNRQFTLGNIRRHRECEPIALTASARVAMDAAREALAA